MKEQNGSLNYMQEIMSHCFRCHQDYKYTHQCSVNGDITPCDFNNPTCKKWLQSLPTGAPTTKFCPNCGTKLN